MGSGIMAHFANAGVDVVMLDIVPPGLSDDDAKNPAKRNQFSAGGLKGALKAKPAAFFHPNYAKRVTIGNLEDNIDLLKGCDLVIEAIIENIDIKRSLLEKLENTLDEGTVVASNTSGLRIADMLQGRGDSFRKNFLVMHFFNPVRYMKLLELVAGEETDPAVMERMKVFGENQLGKGIVVGKDTPNFVGNRIGCYSMSLTMNEMLDAGLTPEDVDAITGPPMGHPKSASFRTADMVGLDTFKHVSDNCYEALVDDPERDVFKPPQFMVAMVEQKILGNKTRGGFYKRTKEGIQTFDPVTLEYRAKGGDADIKKFCKSLKGSPADRVKALVANDGPAGQFAWKVLSRTLAYSANKIGEITDDVEAVDDAMKWGYNWDLGPFETWDAIGFKAGYDRMKAEGLSLPASVDKMVESGAESFYTDDGRVFNLVKGEYEARDIDPRNASLTVMRRGEAPVFSNRGTEAWDLGDGVLGLTFTTKANSIDDTVVEGSRQAVEIAERDFRGMVIYNEGDHFCVGANLFAVVMAAQQKAWDQLRGTRGWAAEHAATDEVLDHPCGGGSVRHDCRRRLRGLHGRGRRAGGFRNLRWPRRGGRGPSAGRCGQHEHALARARGDSRRHRRRHPALRLTHLPEHRDGACRWRRGRGERVRLLPQVGRHFFRQGASADRSQGPRDRHGRGWLPPAAPSLVPASRRKRHGDARHDDRHAAGRRVRE